MSCLSQLQQWRARAYQTRRALYISSTIKHLRARIFEQPTSMLDKPTPMLDKPTPMLDKPTPMLDQPVQEGDLLTQMRSLLLEQQEMEQICVLTGKLIELMEVVNFQLQPSIAAQGAGLVAQLLHKVKQVLAPHGETCPQQLKPETASSGYLSIYVFLGLCLALASDQNYTKQFHSLLEELSGWSLLGMCLTQINDMCANLLVYEIAARGLETSEMKPSVESGEMKPGVESGEMEGSMEMQAFIETVLGQANWREESGADIEAESQRQLICLCLRKCQLGRLEHLINFGLFDELLAAQLVSYCQICVERPISDSQIRNSVNKKWREYFAFDDNLQ